MRSLILAAGLSLGTLFAMPAAEARPGSEAYTASFGQCRHQTCIVSSNPGGNVRQFLAAAMEVLGGAKRLVVIDGPCLSACAIFADVARERVCITTKARFGFHKATVFRAEQRGNKRTMREVSRRDPVHSVDIANWVYAHGGFPVSGMRVMDNRQAGQFWRRCEIRR